MNIFRSKNRKKVQKIWGVISALVIVSMLILYSGFATGGLF